MEKIRFAVIGRGFITERFLAHAALCPCFELTAVCSRRADTARDFAARRGAPLWFDSVEKLAACPQVDAVYIASPTACHARQSIALLRAGKHVLCEKPGAANGAELEQVLAAAAQSGCVWLEAMKPVFEPGFARVRELLAQIGPVRRVSAQFCRRSDHYAAFPQELKSDIDPALAGGALMDVGCYLVHPLVALFGAPQSVQAGALLLPGAADAQTCLQLFWPGMIAQCAAGKMETSALPSEISGENGALLIEKFNEPSRLTLVLRGQEPQPVATGQRAENMLYELETFLDLIDGAGGAALYHGWSRQTMAVLDEARRQIGLRFPADG